MSFNPTRSHRTVHDFSQRRAAYFVLQAKNHNVCEVKYLVHQNLASILENPVGLGIIDNSRQQAMDICMDPLAHNAIVGLLDGIADVTTHTVVSQTIGNLFYWTRKVIKSENFRAVWYELMAGFNMLIDQQKAVRPVVNTAYNGLNTLLTNGEIDNKFETIVKKLSALLKPSTTAKRTGRPQTPRKNTNKRVSS